MKPFTCSSIVAVAFALALVSSPVAADTVTLVNGAAIDGIVTGRHEGYVILTIGNVGTMKIPESDVKKIAKNPRTGYLDPDKGRKKVKKIPNVEKAKKAKSQDSESTESSTESKAATEVDSGEALDPVVAKVIRDLAVELTRQRTTNRTRAERRLAGFGDAAIPELLKLAKHPFNRTRVAVFRLLKKSKDSRVIDPAIGGLEDEDKFVRKLAWEALQNVSGKSYAFPWDSESVSKRGKAQRKWVEWALKRHEELSSEAEKAKTPNPKGSRRPKKI